jgi:metallophosphoesterase superfamily enzyme
MERICVISDIQFPYEDTKAVRNVVDFVHIWQPTEVVQIGDLMDYPQPSRWSKDTKAEFEGSIYKDSETGKRFLGYLRSGYDGPVKVIPGNHDTRPFDYLSKYAPALAESRDFNLDTLLDFDGHGVELIEGFYEFAEGWVMTHGHLGFTLSQLAGRTALLAAKKINKSVVMGHTHRMGLSGESSGYNGNINTLWGFEVGNLCNMAKMPYLKTGSANWQQGFGLIYVSNGEVTPVPVPVHSNGTFTVDGNVFGKRNV